MLSVEKGTVLFEVLPAALLESLTEEAQALWSTQLNQNAHGRKQKHGSAQYLEKQRIPQ